MLLSDTLTTIASAFQQKHRCRYCDTDDYGCMRLRTYSRKRSPAASCRAPKRACAACVFTPQVQPSLQPNFVKYTGLYPLCTVGICPQLARLPALGQCPCQRNAEVKMPTICVKDKKHARHVMKVPQGSQVFKTSDALDPLLH